MKAVLAREEHHAGINAEVGGGVLASDVQASKDGITSFKPWKRVRQAGWQATPKSWSRMRFFRPQAVLTRRFPLVLPFHEARIERLNYFVFTGLAFTSSKKGDITFSSQATRRDFMRVASAFDFSKVSPASRLCSSLGSSCKS